MQHDQLPTQQCAAHLQPNKPCQPHRSASESIHQQQVASSTLIPPFQNPHGDAHTLYLPKSTANRAQSRQHKTSKAHRSAVERHVQEANPPCSMNSHPQSHTDPANKSTPAKIRSGHPKGVRGVCMYIFVQLHFCGHKQLSVPISVGCFRLLCSVSIACSATRNICFICNI